MDKMVGLYSWLEVEYVVNRVNWMMKNVCSEDQTLCLFHLNTENRKDRLDHCHIEVECKVEVGHVERLWAKGTEKQHGWMD